MIFSVNRIVTGPPLVCRSSELWFRSNSKPWLRVMRRPLMCTSRDEKECQQQGVVDVINVEDWGPENMGDLKTKGRVRRVLDNSGELSFMERISNFLADAEQMGKMESLDSVSNRRIPPFERWSFKENHYEQYLVDLVCVNQSMSRAVKQALDAAKKYRIDIEIIDPTHLGLYRGEWIAKDIDQLRRTRMEGYNPSLYISEPSKYARQYARILDDISESLLNSSDIAQIQILVLRYVLMMVHAVLE